MNLKIKKKEPVNEEQLNYKEKEKEQKKTNEEDYLAYMEMLRQKEMEQIKNNDIDNKNKKEEIPYNYEEEIYNNENNILVYESEMEVKEKDIIKSKNIICPECKEDIKIILINFFVNYAKLIFVIFVIKIALIKIMV